MTIKIIRIEEHIVTCELDSGGLIDIGRQWLSQNIQVGEIIEFEYNKND